MGAHDKTCKALERLTPPPPDLTIPRSKTAGAPPFASPPPQPPPNPFKKSDPFTNTKRDIPGDHKFDPKALKPMSKMLWAMSVSLGHALQAYRQFTRLKSITISPDGLVGGRGYVMSVKDVRSKLYEACEALSAISDTIHDEINASHWKPKLGELEKQDLQDIEKFVGEAEGILDDPEGEADEEMEEVEDKKEWSPSRFQEEADNASKIPNGGHNEAAPDQGHHPGNAQRPEMSRQASGSYSYDRTANSSVSPFELDGPRVDHLDRAEDRGPFDSYNEEEPSPKDTDWMRNRPDEYDYPSEWENDVSERVADFGEYSESAVPGDTGTSTEGFDFGIGDGNGNDAHGQGAGGYGLNNPSTGGKGVFGPRADLPSDPGGKTRDTEHSDTTPAIDTSLNERNKFSLGELPGDGEKPVARSDYYRGPKGNDFDGVVHADSAMPGDDTGNPYDSDRDTMDTGYKHEQGDQPYMKWDDSTHNMRPDPINQGGPVQGPYVHQAKRNSNG